MADAGDLKSLALDGRAGSSPALAINLRSSERFFVRSFFVLADLASAFFYFPDFYVVNAAVPLSAPSQREISDVAPPFAEFPFRARRFRQAPFERKIPFRKRQADGGESPQIPR